MLGLGYWCGWLVGSLCVWGVVVGVVCGCFCGGLGWWWWWWRWAMWLSWALLAATVSYEACEAKAARRDVMDGGFLHAYCSP